MIEMLTKPRLRATYHQFTSIHVSLLECIAIALQRAAEEHVRRADRTLDDLFSHAQLLHHQHAVPDDQSGGRLDPRVQLRGPRCICVGESLE